jgi:hypothetical protein
MATSRNCEVPDVTQIKARIQSPEYVRQQWYNVRLLDVGLGRAGNDVIALAGANFTLVDGGNRSNALKVDAVSGLSLDLMNLGQKGKDFNHFLFV